MAGHHFPDEFASLEAGAVVYGDGDGDGDGDGGEGDGASGCADGDPGSEDAMGSFHIGGARRGGAL